MISKRKKFLEIITIFLLVSNRFWRNVSCLLVYYKDLVIIYMQRVNDLIISVGVFLWKPAHIPCYYSIHIYIVSIHTCIVSIHTYIISIHINIHFISPDIWWIDDCDTICNILWLWYCSIWIPVSSSAHCLPFWPVSSSEWLFGHL